MNRTLNKRYIEIYRKRAKHYDITANLYYLFGYREWTYRQKAVAALQLKPGDTILEIACGTGLNFSLYREAIGSKGKIIGVDLTDAMLVQAHQQVKENGWENVELVHMDARKYQFPMEYDAIISTYALSLIPESDQILARAVNGLAPGGRLVLLDLQVPKKWPGWLIKASIWLMKPFAITDDWLARRPWESIRQTMSKLLTNVNIDEMYFGLTYIISGKKV